MYFATSCLEITFLERFLAWLKGLLKQFVEPLSYFFMISTQTLQKNLKKYQFNPKYSWFNGFSLCLVAVYPLKQP